MKKMTMKRRLDDSNFWHYNSIFVFSYVLSCPAPYCPTNITIFGLIVIRLPLLLSRLYHYDENDGNDQIIVYLCPAPSCFHKFALLY